MKGHGINVCEYGTRHGGCRCMDETVRKIECPTPRECAKKANVKLGQPYEPKHRKDTPTRRSL